jgi:transaldolase
VDSGERTVVNALSTLTVKIFADGANLPGMLELYRRPYIKGFTTNPTLMRQAGVTDYAAFARKVLQAIPDRPISFEVFSDDFAEMECQARRMAAWGANVYVKIPVSNTRGEPSYDLVRRLSRAGLRLNVTAVMTLAQVEAVVDALAGGAPSCISVFAGRIADTGRDPVPLMVCALRLMRYAPNAELIWASPREVLNIFQADAIGCHIITVTHDILKKAPTIGKPLDEFSLETVQMFRDDAVTAGFGV